jgi:hypothetical protein
MARPDRSLCRSASLSLFLCRVQCGWSYRTGMSRLGCPRASRVQSDICPRASSFFVETSVHSETHDPLTTNLNQHLVRGSLVRYNTDMPNPRRGGSSRARSLHEWISSSSLHIPRAQCTTTGPKAHPCNQHPDLDIHRAVWQTRQDFLHHDSTSRWQTLWSCLEIQFSSSDHLILHKCY